MIKYILLPLILVIVLIYNLENRDKDCANVSAISNVTPPPIVNLHNRKVFIM